MFRFLDHTADLAVEACGETLKEALEELARAMLTAQLEELEGLSGEKVEVPIEVEEETLEDLIVSFLEEILYTEEVEKLQGFDVSVEELEEGPYRVKAVLKAYRHPPASIIKAITYHQLKVEEKEWEEKGERKKGVCIHVVFDI